MNATYELLTVTCNREEDTMLTGNTERVGIEPVFEARPFQLFESMQKVKNAIYKYFPAHNNGNFYDDCLTVENAGYGRFFICCTLETTASNKLATGSMMRNVMYKLLHKKLYRSTYSFLVRINSKKELTAGDVYKLFNLG